MAVVVIVVGRGGRGGGSIAACCLWSSMAKLNGSFLGREREIFWVKYANGSSGGFCSALKVF